jgi:hypothetical protein
MVNTLILEKSITALHNIITRKNEQKLKDRLEFSYVRARGLARIKIFNRKPFVLSLPSIIIFRNFSSHCFDALGNTIIILTFISTLSVPIYTFFELIYFLIFTYEIILLCISYIF